MLAVAVLFGALSGRRASAKTTLLLTEERGPALAPGASVGMYIEFQEAECVLEGYAAVLAITPGAKDILDESLPVTLCKTPKCPAAPSKKSS